MTDFTPARLAELRGVAEAAEPMMVFGGPAQTTFVSMEKSDVLALIAALEAKTAEVEAWTKPQECVIEHEQPYDFKQCSTHDRTFPLDGDCDYRGLSIIDWQDDQVMKQRGRAVRAEMRADRAEAALERIKGTFFKNHLYLMMMSYPALNNPAGEALHDKIDKLIQQTIEDTHE